MHRARRPPPLPAVAPPPPGWRPSPAARRAALRVLADGHLSDPDGRCQRELEAGVAALCGLDAGRVRALSSGSAAVFAALAAAGVRPGREVLVSALTPPYVAAAVCLAGAVPVAVDVDPASLAMAPAAAAARVGRRTAALLWTAPVGLVGAPGDLLGALGGDAPPIVEDAAQLLGERDEAGRPAGARAFAGAFSLAHGKALGAGEGGLLVLAAAGAAGAVSRLDGVGGRGRDALPRLAPLGRLPLLTATLALASLPELAERQARRRAVWTRLADVAQRVGVPSFRTGGLPLWAGRFATAGAARRAEARAAGLRLELVAPPAWRPSGRRLACARDGAERVRILPWWDAGAARPAEVETLVRAFAAALGADA